MKKITNITLILSVFLYLSCSTDNVSKPTPTKYKVRVKVTKTVYSRDSIQVYRALKQMLNMHLNPFSSKMIYDQQSQLNIDSLIYGPNKLRMVVLVIVRNNTNKLLVKENKEKYYYNGFYLFCSRDNFQAPIKVYERSCFGLMNFYSYGEIKQVLHDYCFLRLFGESSLNDIHYNVDDLRFWNSVDFEWILKNSKPTLGTPE
ncbi:hypothetical protein [Pedobacter gandavensis]|uniref:DUF4136 domain-containing protein n=1 Tax=Pedobacter gandavensis TaxID=2679963 RepID=A0ABR6EQB5_9SPHI|nr:hypothetical protein [Pedobacter gandavensis]MBB2147397.1 hypothetical protein [Pedobacter gandavensis]